MMKNNLIIIGASGHGKVVAEIAERVNCYECIYFIDDYSQEDSFNSYTILGDSTKIREFRDNAEFFVAIGDNDVRKSKYNYLIMEGCSIATLIDPNAIISNSASIGIGTVLMPGAIVNSGTTIGEGSIINTKVSIDHDCVIGAYNHLSPGTTLAGTVKTGENVWIGSGTTVINNITISHDIVIGAGALVIRDIYITGKYVGSPVKFLKPK